ncbi:MAG: prepilin-type N-terminal cleavage/methylation domain-containing protein [Candidatus Pacebacteria bacterium]|nr:prepilin-type N-terminal cleavage/methylation domain-containing protein [Candidatus Paceibacterota bacterium]
MSLSKLFTKHRKARRRAAAARGFTLIEMTVVLAIIVILTGVILVSQSTFNRTLLLTDTAYTVALSVRETQSLGLSSEKFNGVQNAGFGVHFSAGSPSTYLQFTDTSPGSPINIPAWCPTGTAGTPDAKPGNCLYDTAAELVHTYNFNQGFTQSFCAYLNGASVGCSNSGVTTLQSLDIVFLRPNTNTVITGTLSIGPAIQADTACIAVATPTGTYRYIKVTQLGEVSVTQSCP